MTYTEAKQHIHNLMLVVLRTRSIMRESLAKQRGVHDTDATDEAMLTEMHPYLFGERSILRAINVVTEGFERGREMTSGEFYNIFYVLRLQAHTWMALDIVASGMKIKLPSKPARAWLTQWDKET